MGRHYIGDVCAGIPLGLLTVAIVTKVKYSCQAMGCLTPWRSDPRAAHMTLAIVQGCFTPNSMLLDSQHVQKFYDATSKLWPWNAPIGETM